MLDLSKGYLAAVLETAAQNGHLVELSSELATFTTAVVENDDLRRALTEPGIGIAARRAIVAELLSHRALPETSSLVSFLVRVERPAEIPLALASLVGLSEEAARTSAQLAIGEDHGHSFERVRGFAERIFQELEADGLDVVEDELFALAQLFGRERELRFALVDPTVATEARSVILETLLAAKVSPATLRLVRYTAISGRSRDLVGSLERVAELIAIERGRRVAEVRAAVELEDNEKERLAEALQLLVDRPVEVRVLIDPSVVGGTLVSIGDLVIDGTVRLRFERLRDELAQAIT